MQCLAGQSRSFTRVTRRAVHDYLEVIASVEYCVWTDDPEHPFQSILYRVRLFKNHPYYYTQYPINFISTYLMYSHIDASLQC